MTSLRRHVQGLSHLTITPTNPSLRTIFLHASPLFEIYSVTLASPTFICPLIPTPAHYSLSDPFQPLPAREPPSDIRSHKEVKRKTWAAQGEKDEGELAISVSGGWVRLLSDESQYERGTVGFAPIEVQIDYGLVLGGEMVEGIVFRRPRDGAEEVSSKLEIALMIDCSSYVPVSNHVRCGQDLDTLRRFALGEMYLGARVYCTDEPGRG